MNTSPKIDAPSGKITPTPLGPASQGGPLGTTRTKHYIDAPSEEIITQPL